MNRKILYHSIIIILLASTIYSAKYSLKYVHWKTKTRGYPGLYEQEISYPFKPVDSAFANSGWKLLANDRKDDGDLPGWPDAKRVEFKLVQDTVWMRLLLHDNLDINSPMLTLAIEDLGGKDWYGSVSDFKYKDIITGGYFREGALYYGYNFAGSEVGSNKLSYDLYSNSLYLGVPLWILKRYKGKRFIASVGKKGLWNDDIDHLLTVDRFFENE